MPTTDRAHVEPVVIPETETDDPVPDSGTVAFRAWRWEGREGKGEAETGGWIRARVGEPV